MVADQDYDLGMTTKTSGQVLADTLRKNFGVGTRTGRRGKVFGYTTDLHVAMVEAIENAVQYPGFYSPEKTEILREAWGAATSYRKHVGGHRIDGALAFRINGLSAYRFAALLGQMVDASVTNTGEGERFFADLRASA
jgi:hypothetical protein